MICKQLSKNLNKISARNNLGRIVVRTKGGRVKKKYRLIDFKRNKLEKFEILRIEKDPFRNNYIALVCYSNGVLSYINLSESIIVGQHLNNLSDNIEYLSLKVGNSIPLKCVPIGSIINNLELYPNLGSQLIRSAGTFGQVVKKFSDSYIQVKFRSGMQRLLNAENRVVLGINSNINNQLNKLYKAGQNRWLGLRPIVRGRAMNPVDHPHGGRTNGGISPRTPLGRLTKGVKTRKVSKKNKFIIV